MASLVSGPVAMTTSPSGMSQASARIISILGSFSSLSVIYLAKPSRSTASAPPAATRLISALSMTSEPSRRSSSFRRPTAFVRSSPRREFEQTSSAKYSLLCAGVNLSGFISTRRTPTPRRASCQAHSLPARPAPITVTRSIRRPPRRPSWPSSSSPWSSWRRTLASWPLSSWPPPASF